MEEAVLTGMSPLPSGWAARAVEWIRSFRSGPAVPAPLRLESRVSLGPKKSLLLVNCCGKRILLAVAGDAITPVMEVAGRRRPGTAKERAE